MTVAATTNRKTYTGDNVTTSFATSPVIFYATSDLQVRVTVIATGVSTLLTLNTHYTVSGGSAAGATGTVSLAGGSSPHGALLSTEKLVILRVLPLTQAVDLVNNNASDAEVIETALDKLTDVDQQLSERQDRALTFPEGDVSGSTTTLPTASARAGTLLGFDALGVLATVIVTAGTTLVNFATSAGASFIGWIQTGVGAVLRTVLDKLRDQVSVFDFMTAAQIADVRAGTLLLDVTAAINAAIAAVGSGGTVTFPNGAYKTTAFINAENLRGITLIGSSGQYGWNGTRIVGSHTGKTILSLIGTLFARIDNIILEGDTASRPKTGLLLGRSSAASAGNHNFINFKVGGYYSVAGVYNVASESNVWINPEIQPQAAPIAGWYSSQADGLAIGGLTASSMEDNVFIGGTIGNFDNTAGSTGIFLDCGGSTGHFHFYGTFIPKNGGDSFITVRLGTTDGADTTFPIGFHDCMGEHITNKPTTGLHFTGSGSRIISGFIADIRFQDPLTNNILVDGTTAYFVGAKFSTPYRATGNLPSSFYRADVSEFRLLSESSVAFTNTVENCTIVYAGTIPTFGTDKANIVRDISGNTYQVNRQTMSAFFALKRIALAYSASIAIDASLGNEFDITATNNTAFTINAPSNPVDGQRITVTVRNTSGGVMGAITWFTTRMLAFTVPTNGNSCSIDFRYDGTNWIQISPQSLQIPN